MTDPTPETVEAVARAILDNTFDREHESWPPIDAEHYFGLARAAISAHHRALDEAGYTIVRKGPPSVAEVSQRLTDFAAEGRREAAQDQGADNEPQQ